VVCPGGIRLQWEQAIRYWTTLRDVTTYPVLNSRNGINERCNYVIISYDLTRSEHLHEFLCRQHYDLMVIDEAHYLKTPNALRTQALFGSGEQSHHRYVALADRADKVVGLTGTPLPNRPRECYTISRKFDWGAIDWMSEERFRGRFNPTFFGDEKVGRTAELQARLRCNFMIRREEHVLGLQPPRYEVLPIEPDGAIRKALQSEGLIQFQDDDFAKPAIGGDVSTVRKEMGLALAPHAAKHINMVLDGGVNKLVVFIHHHCVREYLEEHVKGKFVRIIGGMSAQAKDLAKQQFINDPDVTHLFANLVAGGTGLDGLQEVCCHAILAESSWVPGENDQAIRRLQRKGQERFVHAQFLVAPGSISERILGSAVGKAKGIHAALDKRHGVVR
jgi:SNF2 family DNA or RNA helicase